MYIKLVMSLMVVLFIVACNSASKPVGKPFELANVEIIKNPIYWVLLQRREKTEFYINGNRLPLELSPCKEKFPCKLSIPANAWLQPNENTLSIKIKDKNQRSPVLFAMAESQIPDGKVFPDWTYESEKKKLHIGSQEPRLLALLVAEEDSDNLVQKVDLAVSPSQTISLGPQHSQLDFRTRGSVGELVLNGVPIYSSREFFNMDFGKTLKKNDPESRVVKDLLEKGFGQSIFEPWTKFLVKGKNRLVYKPEDLPIDFKETSVRLTIRFDSGPLARLLGPGFVGRNLYSAQFNKQQLKNSELVMEFNIPEYVQRPWEMGKTISINSSIQDQIKIRIREAQHVLRQGNKSELQQLFRTYLQYQERIYGDDIGKKVVEYWSELAKSPGFDFYEQGMDNLSYSLYFEDRLLRVKRNDLPALLGYNDNHEQILFPSYFILRESGLEFALD